MANNNRVEVHVGAKTSELKKGMDDAEKIVSDSAKQIENTTKGVSFKFDLSGVKRQFDDVSKSISQGFNNQISEALGGTRIGSAIEGITSKLGLLRGGAMVAAGAVAGLAVGGTAIAAAGLATMAIETAKSNVELARFATLSNTSVQTFQGLSGAAKTFGFSQEKVADMMKDFNEKLGEFASVGSGGAADFFEQIAVKTEGGAAGAKKLAEEMSKMDGVDALQTYVDKLEEAGVNQQQMSFYLESMGSDLTALAPMLQDGGKLWKDYQAAMEEAGIITGDEAIQKSIELAAQTEALQMQYTGLKNQIAQAVMPALSGVISHFMNGVNSGGAFTGVIQTLGSVAKGVGVVIVGLATGLQNLVRLMSGVMSNLKTIGSTAVNFVNADGILAKGKALAGGVKAIWTETGNTIVDVVGNSKAAFNSASNILNGTATFDKLTQATIALQKAQLGAKGGSGGVTSGVGQNKALNPTDKSGESAKAKAEKEAKERQRQAEQAAKALADIRYKYASEEKKVALDLQKALDEIEKSKMTADEKAAAKVKAEKDASDKIIAIRLKEFEEYKKAREEQIDNYQQQAQRLYEIEAARIQAEFDAKKISNVRKVQLEKQLEDQLREIKRQGLLERLALENEQTGITGKQGNQNQITNNISDLETDQKVADTKSMGLISDAEMKDFEAKFGGFTSRLSNLWDQGIQSLMNGTLTWSNATKAVLADMGQFALQTATKELQGWLRIQAIKLARKLGFVGAETAAEASGQAAQTGATIAGEATRTSVTAAGGLARLGLKAAEAIKGIMMSAWEAMAGAFKAMVAIPYVGPILAVGAGAAAFGLVAGLAGKIKSARGGYDIPSGVNPVTQLHEDEMVLPSQHANTIREMGKALRNGASFGAAAVAEGGGAGATINISAIDAKSIQRLLKSNGRAVASGLQSYARGFGKNGK
ncbi:phage tail protein [Acinetobacter baumannii]|uniref:phage tail protein n=1 Tax=Acinetobacter pittii TaxID=48296 RepID=UPI0029547FFD|nr:phage tail protein [Acinetobacter pittii]MDV7707553.1 phage tail protein [Acinetobacter pittii]MDV7761988.1 phage tail protein [Acinetobacter pittii]HEO1789195.1 phage tail protein [Acinetobacter baumannii]